jgi:hypothetical protein
MPVDGISACKLLVVALVGCASAAAGQAQSGVNDVKERALNLRRSIAQGEVTFRVASDVVQLYPDRVGMVERVRVGFFNDLVRSEILESKLFPKGKLLLNKKFLFRGNLREGETVGSFRRREGGDRVDIPWGLFDPRLAGVKADYLMNLDVVGMRDLIGRSDIAETTKETRTINGRAAEVIVDKLTTNGTTIESAYDGNGMPVYIGTKVKLSTGDLFQTRLEMVNAKYGAVFYPQRIDYSRIKNNVVEYHEQATVESARFDTKFTAADFELGSLGLPNESLLIDRGTGERKYLIGNALVDRVPPKISRRPPDPFRFATTRYLAIVGAVGVMAGAAYFARRQWARVRGEAGARRIGTPATGDAKPSQATAG